MDSYGHSNNNKIIKIRTLQFDQDLQKYIVDVPQNCFKVGKFKYKVKSFDPIRILVSKKRCIWKITLNRYVVDNRNNSLLIME